MRNVKQLVRDWGNEDIELGAIKFVSISELAAFINYAFNSVDSSEFDVLMEELQDLI